MTTLKRLQAWYESHCDGDWEHGEGIHIETLDNPGWCVRIPLRDTELESRPFQEVSRLEPERDWIRCWIEDGCFQGTGGSQMLDQILETFLFWAEGDGK
jgi:hypothetical protein